MSAPRRRPTDDLVKRASLVALIASSLVAPGRAHADEDAGALASVSFEVVPAGVAELELRVDERPLSREALGRTFHIAPGEHLVEARGVVGGRRALARQTVVVAPGGRADVRVVMVPESTDPGALTPGQIACMKVDKTPEEAAACFCGDEATVGQRPGCHACVVGVGAPGGARTWLVGAAIAVLFRARTRRPKGT